MSKCGDDVDMFTWGRIVSSSQKRAHVDWNDDDRKYNFPLLRYCARSTRRPHEVQDAISFLEAAILLVIDGDRDLWSGPTPEVHDSRTSRHSAHAQNQVWQIWLVEVSIYCVPKAIENQNVVGPGQGSRFPAHDKRDPWGRGCPWHYISPIDSLILIWWIKWLSL